MKNLCTSIICCLFVFHSFGQETKTDSDHEIAVDSLYREDQFYIGVTFNLLHNTPKNINQSGFSGGMHLGFIRDMPINKRRNFAIGIGVGYSLNVYNQNLFIKKNQDTGQTIFSSLGGIDYDVNRFTTHLIEAPFELRWRTSVPKTHKFYRIYTGIKMGYLHSFNANLKQPGNKERVTKIGELNRWRVGATFAFGWNTFNFYFYYSLNPLFNNDAIIDGEAVGMNTAKIGLMFYIL
ncbi:porin family protein [Aquimarina longa]|uniref:porin family protein n=1 Tax=Aquimarina longa TaxID=1080221 RepID=UPI000780E8BC|nr:porin family protein [Aquimarina longa]